MGSNLDNTQNKGCLSRIPSLDISYSALKVSMPWFLLIVCPLTPESSKTPRHRRPVQRHRRGHLEVFLGILLASRSVWGTGLLSLQ